MKPFLPFTILILIFNLSYGQFSKKYIEFSSSVSPVDSTLHEKHFSNGKIKERGKLLIYKTEKYFYEIPSGTWIRYYRTGEVLHITEYNNFGEIKNWTLFEKDGTVVWTANLKSVETRANNIDEFLHSRNKSDVKLYEKRFSYSNKLCKWYLKSEGFTLNNTKIGLWKTYNPDGSLKKESNH